MLDTIWFICSISLILLILFRLPNKGSMQNFNMGSDVLGSPQTTSDKLNQLVWFLTIIFLLLSSFKSL
jgi:protein translocase SecG subunit